MSLIELSLHEAAAQVRARKVSPVELTEACLDRIDETEPKINAFVKAFTDEALQTARQAEQEISTGNYRGPLHGIPIAVKDLFDMEGAATTASSRVRADSVPAAQDSACVERLRAAGAIIIGKTQMHEFAYGVTTPTTRNPWDTSCIPGGSSGGSGAAVAAGSCFMAMGSDTGGSIRIPAALCGTIGFKPTFGLVSRFGMVPLSWSEDHAGPLTRSVRDAAMTLNEIAGHDPRDSGSAKVPIPDYLEGLEAGVKGLCLGVPQNHFFDRIDSEVEAHVRKAIALLEKEGAVLRDVVLPHAELCLPVGLTICMAEASAYHGKTIRSRPQDYQEDVRTMLEAGNVIPAVDYVNAQRIRENIKMAWREAMDGIDALVTPTAVLTAAKVGQQICIWPDGTEEPLLPAYARNTAPLDITGQPAATVPCGFTEGGLPIGLQFAGRPFEDAKVLRIAHAYESVAGWSGRKPNF